LPQDKKNVFSKLYKDAEIRRTMINRHYEGKNKSQLDLRTSGNSLIDQKLLRGGGVVNYGERLYYKCQKLKEENELKNDLKKQEIERKNEEICTFQPSTGVREFIADGKVLNCLKEEQILHYNHYKQQIVDKAREKFEERKYSFSPEINRRSQELVNELDSKKIIFSEAKNVNNFEELYSDAKKRVMKHKQIENDYYANYNFKPVINPSSIQSNFEERQEILKQKSRELLKSSSDQYLIKKSLKPCSSAVLFKCLF
jgi:hypothetical protein